MEFDLLKHLIAVHLTGSHAYGTATDKSDIDLGGVLIPPKEYLLGFSKRIEQTEDIKPIIEKYKDKLKTEHKIEGMIFSLHKFIKLCSDCNPNMIERLWIEPKDFLYMSPEFESLVEIRDSFLSTKARFTFSGYAHSQIKRIKTHRKWILDPPESKPTREEFKLPETKTSQYDEAEALIRHEIDKWAFHDLNLSEEISDAVKSKISEQLAYSIKSKSLDHDVLNFDDPTATRKSAMIKIGFDENLMDLLDREYKYRKALTHFDQYQNWKKSRNKERAELEAKYRYDSKHGAHVVRLYRMGEEILRDGKVIVKRPDAEELLAIRNGAWSYEKMIEFSEKMDQSLKDIYDKSPLKKKPDIEKIEKVCISIVEKRLSI